jgi:tRNA A-37 threonylcarbamoyl transferase component Bud32
MSELDSSRAAASYRLIRTPSIVAYLHRDWESHASELEDLLDQVLASPGDVRRRGNGQGVTALRDMWGGQYFVKAYMPGRWSRRLRDLFGQARALREWRCNVDATDAGVALAPLVLALSERRSWNARHLVITAPAPGIRVSDIFDGHVESPMKIDALVQLMGRELARLHRVGFFHRHFKATHLFLQPDHSFVCIDVESSRVVNPLPQQLREENLGQIRRSLERYPITKGRFEALKDVYRSVFESGACRKS